MQTEFEFVLPRGYVDDAGNVHGRGVMRLATARDEVEPLSDPRVKLNELYLGLLLLSRVVTRLGGISPVPVAVIEGLFSSDYAHLQDVYLRLNTVQLNTVQLNTVQLNTVQLNTVQLNTVQLNTLGSVIETRCPNCGTPFELDLGAP